MAAVIATFFVDELAAAVPLTGRVLLGIFPFVIMFLITSIATLRERTTGTLERLMTMPIGKLDLLFGYAIAFGVLAFFQVAIVAVVTLTWLGLEIAGSVWVLLLVAVLDALLGMALGSLGGLDTALREHLAGYRSHTTVIASLPAVTTAAALYFARVAWPGLVIAAAGPRSREFNGRAGGPEVRHQPTVAMLEELDDIDGLIVASPANPTGTVLPPDELAALAAYCQGRGIQLISDEIYHGISYPGTPSTSCAWTTSREAIVVNSFSKYFSMTGWRLGWLLVPQRPRRAPGRAAAGRHPAAPPGPGLGRGAHRGQRGQPRPRRDREPCHRFAHSRPSVCRMGRSRARPDHGRCRPGRPVRPPAPADTAASRAGPRRGSRGTGHPARPRGRAERRAHPPHNAAAR